MRKKLLTPVVGVLVAVTALVGFHLLSGESQAAWNGKDCSTNAVIRCGVFGIGTLREKYNASKEMQGLFAYKGIDLSSNTINKGQWRHGVVHKDGRVTVDGKVLATGAHSVGRENIAGTNSTSFRAGGTTWYKRSVTSQNIFIHGDMTAFVFVDKDGHYVGAMLKSCGNPIFAKPTPKPTPPKPTPPAPEPPKPTPPKPEPPKPQPPKPTPAAECVLLNATKLNRTTVRFNAEARVSGGATISNYYFAVKNVPTSGPSVDPILWEHTVNTARTTATVTKDFADVNTLPAGTYQAQVVVNTSVGPKTGTNCIVNFTIPEKPVEPKPITVCELKTREIIEIDERDFDPELHSRDLDDCKDEPLVKVCDPKTGEIITVKESEAHKYEPIDSDKCKEAEPPVDNPKGPEVPEELPQTGLVGTLGSLLSLGSLTAAGYYYHGSRQSLLESFKKK